MKNIMKILACVCVLSLAVPLSYGQAAPAGNTTISSTGSNPNVPPLDGILHYSVSASSKSNSGITGQRNDLFDGLDRKPCVYREERDQTV